jgi:ABC-type dipeptide/oligopeptide/nickel transport system permease component
VKGVQKVTVPLESELGSVLAGETYHMTARTIVSFLLHSIAATVGSVLTGILLAFLLALPIGLFSSGMGNVVDRATDTSVFRYADNPYFAVPVAIAACLGFLSHRFSKSRSGAWSWVLPTAVLFLNIFPKMANSAQERKWIIDNFFSRGCGGTECLYELFITAPFYTSVAYTIGWLSRR